MTTTIIIDGSRAGSYIETGDDGRNLTRLLDAGIIRAATDTDTARIAKMHTVYMRSGATWGSGTYVLETADKVYAMADGFNHGHLEMALRRMSEQAREAKLTDLYARLDATA